MTATSAGTFVLQIVAQGVAAKIVKTLTAHDIAKITRNYEGDSYGGGAVIVNTYAADVYKLVEEVFTKAGKKSTTKVNASTYNHAAVAVNQFFREEDITNTVVATYTAINREARQNKLVNIKVAFKPARMEVADADNIATPLTAGAL